MEMEEEREDAADVSKSSLISSPGAIESVTVKGIIVIIIIIIMKRERLTDVTVKTLAGDDMTLMLMLLAEKSTHWALIEFLLLLLKLSKCCLKVYESIN